MSQSVATTSKFGTPVEPDVLKACATPGKTKEQTNWCVSRWRESRNRDQDSMGEVPPCRIDFDGLTEHTPRLVASDSHAQFVSLTLL